jgi:hypothetical protein
MNGQQGALAMPKYLFKAHRVMTVYQYADVVIEADDAVTAQEIAGEMNRRGRFNWKDGVAEVSMPEYELLAETDPLSAAPNPPRDGG